MPAPEPPGGAARGEDRPDADGVAGLIPLVRRVIGARAPDRATEDDMVQETLTRVLSASDRIDPGMLEPYAIVTARHVMASLWRERDRERRHQHRVLDLDLTEAPDAGVLADEDRTAMAEALARLPARERDVLVAHEVAGADTRSLADELGSTAGAVAAQLNRTRARLRVEFLIAAEHADPPTERCRPVLLALSSGDRRRQREADAAHHLLECALCARLSGPLVERGRAREDEVSVLVHADADVVAARQAARELASRLGFPGTQLTVLATAVSEVVRNIVRFAGSGELLVELIGRPRPGVRVTARDAGPGIPDVARALRDGYSTGRGLGLGLPGARRLVDEFSIESEPGRGTTVTMIMWRDHPRPQRS